MPFFFSNTNSLICGMKPTRFLIPESCVKNAVFGHSRDIGFPGQGFLTPEGRAKGALS